MQFSNLSALSLSELKALVTSNNVVPTGDKRVRQSWIDALELLSDSQMECQAVEVDMAKEIIERLEELSVEPEGETESEWEARSGEYIGLSEVLGDIQTEIKTSLDITSADIWTEESALTQAVELASFNPGDFRDSDVSRLSGAKEVLNRKSEKPGAISVIAMLLCAIIAVIQAAIVIGCAIGSAIIYSRSILNQSDTWEQLYTLTQQRKLDIACT